MLKYIFIISFFIILTGCNDSKPDKHYDGKKLMKNRCSSCHNLNMPPIVSNDELAPPMMAVAFHVRSFVKPSDESQRITKAIEFVKDYVYNPSLKKSFCDKSSLKRYGLMPSQKKNVTQDELDAIANYLFEHYNQENLLRIEKEKREYDALDEGKKIALKNRCLVCHNIKRKIVGPSFQKIAQKSTLQEIKYVIKNGSQNRWKESNRAVMPAFKNMDEKELNELSKWLMKQK